MSKKLEMHGLSKSLVRNSYRAAKERCENKNNKNYNIYGGRGIEFRINSLLELIDEIGDRPSKDYTLERINNDGHYEKGNIKWALRKEQMRNQSMNVNITWNFKTQCLSDWSNELNISLQTLHSRINKLKWCISCSFTIVSNKATRGNTVRKCIHI